jgi:hypothetical protein
MTCAGEISGASQVCGLERIMVQVYRPVSLPLLHASLHFHMVALFSYDWSPVVLTGA